MSDTHTPSLTQILNIFIEKRLDLKSEEYFLKFAVDSRNDNLASKLMCTMPPKALVHYSKEEGSLKNIAYQTLN